MNNITEVYFVRHASANYNNHDDMTRELTSRGMEDRRLVTELLADKSIDIVLSSPYKRAVDTVKEFADLRGLPIHIIDDFRERAVGNEWLEDFDGFARRQWEDFSYNLPGGEGLGEVQRRNIDALERVLENYRGKNIVIGSHGTALSTVINYYDSSFGYREFCEIKNLMPWVVRFSFDGAELLKIKKFDRLN